MEEAKDALTNLRSHLGALLENISCQNLGVESPNFHVSSDISSSSSGATRHPLPEKTCFYCHTTESLLWDNSELNRGERLCDKCFFYEVVHRRPPPASESYTGGLMSRSRLVNKGEHGDEEKTDAERRRAGQACDQCRELSKKCEPVENTASCRLCEPRGWKCEYKQPLRKKRRPKNLEELGHIQPPMGLFTPQNLPGSEANGISSQENQPIAPSSDTSVGSFPNVSQYLSYLVPRVQTQASGSSSPTTPDSGRASPFNSYVGYSELSSNMPGTQPSTPPSDDMYPSSYGEQEHIFVNPVVLSAPSTPDISRPPSPLPTLPRSNQTLLEPLSTISSKEPLKCPIPKCSRTYKSMNDLEYHLAYGRCTSEEVEAQPIPNISESGYKPGSKLYNCTSCKSRKMRCIGQGAVCKRCEAFGIECVRIPAKRADADMVSQKQNEVLGPYASLLESTSTNMAGIEEDTSAGRELLNNDRGSRLTAAILPHQDRAILGSLEPTTVLSKQSDIAVQTAAPAVGDELESGRGTTLLYGTGNTLVQSSENGISSLDDALAKFSPDISPLHSPIAWLQASRKYLSLNLCNFSHLVDWEETGCMQLIAEESSIYQRFVIYTFAHITLCAQQSGQRLLDGLKKALKLWRTWDHVTVLLNQRCISKYLWTCIRICKHVSVHECDKGDRLRSLLAFDVAGICAQMAFILQGPTTYKSLISRQGKEAQVLLNLLQAFLDISHLDSRLKSTFLRALFRLSRKSRLYPECLVLGGVEGLGKDAVAAGRFGDVFKAVIDNQSVAIKVVRMYLKSDVLELAKLFSQEAVTWSQLLHPNILPFYGIYHLNDDRSRVCFVSPWMENGTLVDFLKHDRQADRHSLYFDVALGLEYLHTMSPRIVHGDLKGVNILITPSGRACLSDFGLATAGDSRLLRWSASTARTGGTIRWQAPELLSPEEDSDGRNTLATDIYAFACVGYEIFADNVPFYEVVNEGRIILDVTRGKRPMRPATEIATQHGLNDDLWNLIVDCWKMEHRERPTATTVVKRLEAIPILAGKAKNAFIPNSDWDPSFVGRFRSNLDEHPFCPPTVVNVGWVGALDPAMNTTAMLTSQLESFTWSFWPGPLEPDDLLPDSDGDTGEPAMKSATATAKRVLRYSDSQSEVASKRFKT